MAGPDPAVRLGIIAVVAGIDVGTAQAEGLIPRHHGVGEGRALLEFLVMPAEVDQVLLERQAGRRPLRVWAEDALQMIDAAHHGVVILDHVGNDQGAQDEIRMFQARRHHEICGNERCGFIHGFQSAST